MPRRPSGNKYIKLVRVVTSGEEVITLAGWLKENLALAILLFHFIRRK